MGKWLICFIVVFLISNVPGRAQITFGNDLRLLQRIDLEDKLIAEFFDRFNYEEVVKFPTGLKSTPARNIISLLNLKDTVLYNSSETASFIKYVSGDTNKVCLDYENHNWFALTKCSFTYRNKILLVNIILKPEGNLKSGYKWVITDINSDMFNFSQSGKLSSGFINPMNHELGFSELTKALNGKSNIFLYTPADYKYDPLTIFLFMVKNGDIKFNQIKSTEFRFLQVNNWIFKVKNFNRADFNSGWLIYSIKTMSDEEKKKYISNHFIE